MRPSSALWALRRENRELRSKLAIAERVVALNPAAPASENQPSQTRFEMRGQDLGCLSRENDARGA